MVPDRPRCRQGRGREETERLKKLLESALSK
jgi:hypothetical protein